MIIRELLVEGKNDRHVVWSLCEIYRVPKVFSVETPKNDSGGIEQLIESIPVRLKRAGLSSLGIVIDADEDLDSRWESIRYVLTSFGYKAVTSDLPASGLIHQENGLPRIGIWIMPNNHLSSDLESFIRFLIPDGDTLEGSVEDFLQTIESQNQHKYTPKHRTKAFIHAWLACQKSPGQPMGQAITAQSLQANKPLAQQFVAWITALFVNPQE